MPQRVWRSTEAKWEAPALLKRIYLDVSGRARGYVAVKGETGALYYAGTPPHLTEYATEREARRHPIQLARDMIVTLPGEVACQSMTLHHIAGLGEKEYIVRGFRAHLLNAITSVARLELDTAEIGSGAEDSNV